MKLNSHTPNSNAALSIKGLGKFLFFLGILSSLFISACPTDSGGPPVSSPAPSSAKAITALAIPGAVSVDIKPAAKTIAVTVSRNTALTSLAPIITLSPGASVSPASGAVKNFFDGGYTPVTYTVTAADKSIAIWTVTVKWQALTVTGNIGTDITTYFGDLPANAGDGSDADHPIILPVAINLNENSNWADLLGAISGKYVALDLSACTMTGTEFDPGTANTGEAKIVSLILPNTATSIKDGTSYSESTFKNFIALKSVVGETITSVGESAFGGCTSLTTVSLPAVASIGKSAFGECTSLETVSLLAVTSIGEFAFLGCTSLATVSLPAVASIEEEAFYGCTSLATVSLPKATSIGDSAFYNCTSLAMISLPAATNIGNTAFIGCTSLAMISLPAATNIGNTAFAGCTSLTTVSLPAAASIGNDAFGVCTSLTTVSLPASLTSINGNPFAGCTSLSAVTVAANNPKYRVQDGKLLSKDGKTLISWPTATATIDLPGITSIGDSAFNRCTSLETVNLPAAASIGNAAFAGCTSLTTVSLPAAASIGAGTFAGCTSLTTVDLPAAAGIGEGAFGSTGTTSLTVTLGANTPPALGTEIFNWVTSGKNVTVQVPNGAATAYGTATNNTADNWGNGFRGGGWDGDNMTDNSKINSNITLAISELPAP